MFLLFVILCAYPVLAAPPPPPLRCISQDGLYVDVLESTLCAECQFRSRIIGNGDQCEYQSVISSDLLLSNYTTSDCTQPNNIDDFSLAYCSITFNNITQCLTSKYGRKCNECSGNGFLERDAIGLKCKCYNNILSPKTCSIPSGNNYVKLNNTLLKYQKITCDAFQSTKYGCYKPVDSSNHKYGEPNPPIPRECCREVYGPPPGELLENLYAGTIQQYEECNIYGGIDKNEMFPWSNSTGFRACNNHGDWLPETRECICHNGWKLDIIGKNISDIDVSSCITCMNGWGPLPSTIIRPPFCSKIYTPHVITGELAECSGRGDFINGQCNCYSNTTIGYWKLLELDTNSSILTCAGCLNGTFPTCL
jgi:hypothetical protein